MAREKSVKKKSKTKPAEQDFDESRIRPVSEVPSHRSYVFYGRSATGKTTLAASFPKPLLLLDVKDRGTDSISDVKGVSQMDIENWDDLELIYWHLKKNPKKYKTLVIDTMSQVQQVLIEKIVGDSLAEGKRAGDWGTMRKQDWGTVSSSLKGAIVQFRDLPMEVVFIAQDRVFNMGDDEGDEALTPEVGPGLIPSVVKTLNAAVNVIGMTFIREKITIKRDKKTKKRKETRKVQYCIRIGPHSVYTTKMRKPKSVELPQVIVDPSYEDLIEIIKGE